ncbi:MAG: UvrD-helicase domain-containing protein [Victivallales bacterium]|nr:UvrD-helicase domain-containing protein [Victivallales bacterium]
MKVIAYNELDTKGVSKQYAKVVRMLENEDFRSAEVKKISGNSLYRAKLDYTNRLLFKLVKYRHAVYALILEIIRNHNYAGSKFLNGAAVNEEKLKDVLDTASLKEKDFSPITYINDKNSNFNVLDKILSFDDVQNEVFNLRTPIIIIGSAGSGKTVLTLEKLKHLHGDGLYVTLSPYLVENSRNLYYSNYYVNDKQNIDFLSFREFIETIKIPAGKEISVESFNEWFLRNKANFKIKDSHKIYEEFNGVLSGSTVNAQYLTKEEYLSKGIKQSIFNNFEREEVYNIFERYLKFLSMSEFYDTNIISYDYLKLCSPKYDFVIVDEVQDLTASQLNLIIKSLKNVHNFILCGDSNQIVHPNFFSWATVKTLFYEKKTYEPKKLIRVLNKNFRNSPEVTNISNDLLLLKNRRFGSIDKESNFLVNSSLSNSGSIELLKNSPAIKAKLNNNTASSTKYAVIVMRNEDKAEASKFFKTPLIFSIQEAKGLEYENIILYNFVSANAKEFTQITEGVSKEDLKKELKYARNRNKADKTLETYKFYINSLYVAFTRAVKNLFIIENNRKHNLLELLGLIDFSDQTNVKKQESNSDDWKREAHRLELQGKKEQADAIKRKILKTIDVPWDVLTYESLPDKITEAFNPERYNNQVKMLIFEYAVIYHVPYLIDRLIEFKFNRAKRADIEIRNIQRKYYSEYTAKNYNNLNQKINKYGIDFRNKINQTPLMIATEHGKVDLIKSLIKNDADISLRDSVGRQAQHIALRKAFTDSKYAENVLAEVYRLLETSSFKVKVHDKMIKIDNRCMPFFIFNLMFSAQVELMKNKIDYDVPAFQAGDFVKALAAFPESIMPAYRKKRSYISSILSGNELMKTTGSGYNRKIFLRIRTGYYMINPILEIDVNDKWVNAYELMQMEHYKSSSISIHKRVMEFLETRKKDITEHLEMITNYG